MASNLRPRVVVTVPDNPPRVYRGERHGTYRNARGEWHSVMIDGCRTISFFWHEYVQREAREV